MAQIAPKMGDTEANFEKVIRNIRKAQAEKAHLVVFPELATSGYLSQGIFLDVAEREHTYLAELIKMSKDIHVVLGIIEETEYGILHNAAAVFGNGRIIHGHAGEFSQSCYKKCYLPTYGMFEEHRWFTPGERIPTFSLEIPNLGQVRTGVVICEDFWHPLPVATCCMRGAQLVCAISSSPKTLLKPMMVNSLITTRAVENCVYVAFVNSAGSQDMVNFWGGSRIVSPEGETIIKAKDMEEDLVVGEIDLYRLKKARQLNPLLRDERREMIEDYLNAYGEMRNA